jgi:hypothetical protein
VYEILDGIVFAVSAATSKSPHSLSTIIHGIDHKERVVATYEELLAGLKELVEAGRIGQKGMTFYATPSRSARKKRLFTAFTRDEYQHALDEYHRRFADAMRPSRPSRHGLRPRKK